MKWYLLSKAEKRPLSNPPCPQTINDLLAVCFLRVIVPIDEGLMLYSARIFCFRGFVKKHTVSLLALFS